MADQHILKQNFSVQVDIEARWHDCGWVIALSEEKWRMSQMMGRMDGWKYIWAIVAIISCPRGRLGWRVGHGRLELTYLMLPTCRLLVCWNRRRGPPMDAGDAWW
jgi:hypothetical protein